MSTLFRGRFDCKIDPKGRIKLPTIYRQVLPQRDVKVVITNGQYQGRRCLEACSVAEWNNLELRIAKLSPLQAEVQTYRRFYMAGAQIIEGDAQDRLLIPQTLRQYANLRDQAVLIGMGTKFEIWAADLWQELYHNMAENFDQVLAKVAALEKKENE